MVYIHNVTAKERLLLEVSAVRFQLDDVEPNTIVVDNDDIATALQLMGRNN